MDGWVAGWLAGWLEGWVDERMNKCEAVFMILCEAYENC